jgi:hypothetical protein
MCRTVTPVLFLPYEETATCCQAGGIDAGNCFGYFSIAL